MDVMFCGMLLMTPTLRYSTRQRCSQHMFLTWRSTTRRGMTCSTPATTSRTWRTCPRSSPCFQQTVPSSESPSAPAGQSPRRRRRQCPPQKPLLGPSQQRRRSLERPVSRRHQPHDRRDPYEHGVNPFPLCLHHPRHGSGAGVGNIAQGEATPGRSGWFRYSYML